MFLLPLRLQVHKVIVCKMLIKPIIHLPVLFSLELKVIIGDGICSSYSLCTINLKPFLMPSHLKRT